MKIVFIGSVELSKHILQKLINLKANIVGIVTKKTSSFNADFVDLSEIANNNNIPYKYTRDINSIEDIKWIKKINPDMIFCFGFSQILGEKILSVAPMGVVGFHPAKLPQNRGRHPIIWALVLGLEKTASSFFFMDREADSGDILDQAEIDIDCGDDARSLYDKLIKTASIQIENFLPKLQNHTFKRITQDRTKANYWRKREEKDGQIDFRMSSRAVYNLVRGLTRPYVGAHIIYKDKKIKIWRAKEASCDLKNYEYGKVLKIDNNQVLVKCYDNAIFFTEHEFKELPKVGEYLQ